MNVVVFCSFWRPLCPSVITLKTQSKYEDKEGPGSRQLKKEKAVHSQTDCSRAPCGTAPPLLYIFLGRSAVLIRRVVLCWQFWFQWFNLLVGLKELMVQLRSCISQVNSLVTIALL